MESNSGDFKNVYFGVRAPNGLSAEVPKEDSCEARPKLETLQKLVPGGKKTVWWPWWNWTDIRDCTPEAMARIVLNSPNGKVDQHPGIQQLARNLVQLAEAVDTALKAQ